MTNPSSSSHLLDGTCTTVDWQTATTRLAVLPIGSFEQHGGRLPLLTDTLLAEYFSKRLAATLNAALLPVIAYATCLEHTGFRGSISLRPETAMAVIRDIITSLEQQHFQRVIIVNGHGGNFFLGPVLREINAQDRAIKILTVDCGGPFDSSEEGRCYHGCELHAGAGEISRIMAILPAVVKPPSQAIPLAGKVNPLFQRSDLNTFGVGVYDASGVWGDPAGGSAAVGAAMNDSIHANQVKHVKARLAWLDAQPGYSGSGGIAIRQMISADTNDGLRLCRSARWNHLRDDWRLFQELNPTGCQVAVHMGEVIGTVSTLTFPAGTGWISMVLVDPERRRLGIGTKLLHAAMASLSSCTSIGLDATAAGKAVYDRLGFVDRYALVRMTRPRNAPISVPAPATVRAMTENDFAAVVAFDQQVGGVNREALLRWLFTNASTRAWVATNIAGAVTGFCLGRQGENFDHIGPVLATDITVAMTLVHAGLHAIAGKMAGIDIYPHPDWMLSLERIGFVEERRFMRMAKGNVTHHEQLDRLFAIAGPELS